MGQLDGQDTQDAGRDGLLKRLWRRGDGSPRMRAVVVATGIFAVVIAPAGVAATGSVLKEGVRNGTATKETQIISKAPASTGLTGGYATRQSNLSSTGGGAVYGCRTGAGGSAANPPQNPCVRSNNLDKGFAFEFNATSGDVVGLISSSSGGDTKKPFVTNATGVATGLNADRLDSLDAADIQKNATDVAAADATSKANAARTRYAVVNGQGQIVEQSGGFSIASFNDNDNVYINAGGSLVGHGLGATLALANGGGDLTTNGQIVTARCNTATVTCAPANTNNDNTLVVRATDNTGAATTPATRKGFTVTVTP
jgi:hypothetical protein